MGAARFQTAAHVGHAVIAGDDLPMGHGAAAVAGLHRHLFPIGGMPPDGCVHRAAVLPQITHHQTLVCPGQSMVAELGAEGQMGGIVLGGDDQAAGVPVDAVDDTGPLFAADAGQRIAAVMQQGVDQRAVGMARRRMHHQPTGLFTTITS